VRPKYDTWGILSSVRLWIRTREVRNRKKHSNMKADHLEQDDRKITEIKSLFLLLLYPPSLVFFPLLRRILLSTTPHHHHIPDLLLATGDFPPPRLAVEEIRSSSFRELLDSSWSVKVLFIPYHFSMPFPPPNCYCCYTVVLMVLIC
jgi:hypothetical protein